MSDRLDQIMYYAGLLNIQVAEEDLDSDMDEIADMVSDEFWDEMYRDGDYDVARDAADDMIGEELSNFRYISERMEQEEGWDESDDYDSFRELIREEVFERADVPEDEIDAQERMEDDEEEDEDNS